MKILNTKNIKLAFIFLMTDKYLRSFKSNGFEKLDPFACNNNNYYGLRTGGRQEKKTQQAFYYHEA
jgi:hypothetical protein